MAAATPGPSAISVPSAFKTLVKILAGMFYSGQCPPPWWVDAADPKKEAPDPEHAMFQQEKKAAQLSREAKRKAQQDTTGLGVILLTSLTEVQWVEEDEFARSLNLPPKMVRKAMRFLEQEQLVQREHRKESVRHRKHERALMVKAGLRQGPGGSAAAAAGGDPAAAGQGPEEEEEAIVSKGHVITYCALDYPRIVDSVRWRIATMKANLKKEIHNDDAVQRYKCSHPQCGKQYTSMDVTELVSWGPASMAPGKGAAASKPAFSCSICGSEVAMVLDEGGKELGSMEDKKERRQRARAMLSSMDQNLLPLTTQLDAIADMNPPDLLSYPAWLTNEAGLKQRLQVMNAQGAQGGAGGGSNKQSGVLPAFNINTQVVINFADPSSSDGAQALPGAASSGGPAAAAAAAGGRGGGAAGKAGGAAAGAAGPSSVKPPWLSKHTPGGQQQQASKPTPPWLISAHQQSLAAAGLSTSQQQLGGSTGFGLSLGIKPDVGGGRQGLKPDPGVKVEGLKPDPGFKQEDNDDDDDDNMWEDVQDGDGDAASPGDAAAGSSQGGSLAAALDDGLDQDEEWEDV